MCVCVFSGSADRRVCQWVFLSPVSTTDQQQQHCSYRTVPDIMEEVCTHTRGCCWVINGFEQACKAINSVLTLLYRESSSADSPLIQTTVTLPHVILESVPLYIHAGQSSEYTHHMHCTHYGTWCFVLKSLILQLLLCTHCAHMWYIFVLFSLLFPDEFDL